jgi:cytochrome c biogenesis protein
MASIKSSAKSLESQIAPETGSLASSATVSAGGEATMSEGAQAKPRGAKAAPQWSISRGIDAFLNLISSVPFGIFQLVMLIIACMIGMLIQQVELETFAKYYAELTPAEKIIYGRLGFFDIYHVWYFNLLLLLLSLNIILASIDHFPAAWSFVRRKKLTASPTFAMAQRFREKVELPHATREQLVERATKAARSQKFGVKVTAEENRTTIFAERGAWNRLGAYAVHVGLLTIFAGGFLTSRGHTGGMWVEPGKTDNKMSKQVFNLENATNQFAVGKQDLQLPFTIEGIDIQQKLIDKSKSIDTGNTLDWLTRVKIRDPEMGEEREALIHMNKPYDYRGYRFFQASFTSFGAAREIKLRIAAAGSTQSEEVTIERNGEKRLPDGTVVRFIEFNPDFTVDANRQVGVGPGVTSFDTPAAHLDIRKPSGERVEVWAFTEDQQKKMANAPFLAQAFLNMGGYQVTLLDFEKVPQAHMLSIQYDPGVKVVYIGFLTLCLTLILVFFFSHQRMWIVVEEGVVSLGGDANRNRLGFEDRLKKIAARIREPQPAAAE